MSFCDDSSSLTNSMSSVFFSSSTLVHLITEPEMSDSFFYTVTNILAIFTKPPGTEVLLLKNFKKTVGNHNIF